MPLSPKGPQTPPFVSTLIISIQPRINWVVREGSKKTNPPLLNLHHCFKKGFHQIFLGFQVFPDFLAPLEKTHSRCESSFLLELNGNVLHQSTPLRLLQNSGFTIKQECPCLLVRSQKQGGTHPVPRRPSRAIPGFFYLWNKRQSWWCFHCFVNELLSLFCLCCERPPGSDFANPIFVVFHLEKFKLIKSLPTF